MAAMITVNRHTQNLANLCRICGNLLTGKVKHDVKEHASRLEKVFSSKFELDLEQIHPLATAMFVMPRF